MSHRARSAQTVSYNMSRIRSRGTSLEVDFGRALWAAGVRYRKHYTVTGRPDFALPGLKIAIFCDSHFWHGYRWNRGAKDQLKVRRRFWIQKIERNIERDREVNRTLRQDGWVVVRFWEHQLKTSTGRCVERVLTAAGKRSGGVD